MKFKSLRFQRRGAVGILLLNRPQKRNALSDAMVEEIGACVAAVPMGVKALVLHGAGEHFCAGLDLAELSGRSAAAGVAHSRGWHRIFDRIQFGRVPVVAVMHGAVVGGGLELACTAHVRIAEKGAFYALPEGQRGIFVGGGASVRLPRLIGTARMADMMFTGRVYSAEEGQAAGISTYLVPKGKGLAKGIELAGRIAGNAPATNFALMHALPRIAELGQDAGLLMESLVAGIAQSEPEAKRRMTDFLEKRAAKVARKA
ncbi:MAG TPA: crotonase/enoyl-CoA hydratase family protein [Burkholderiales bacterium]|nr:crotonase/enoyl-CoA hydratase family protein [Burkholderiales bacterium]